MVRPSSSAAAALMLAGYVTSNAKMRSFWSLVSANRRSSEADLGSRQARVDQPANAQILSGELEPESPIGTGDQDAWHRMLPVHKELRSPGPWTPGLSLVRRHDFPSQFFDRLLVL